MLQRLGLGVVRSPQRFALSACCSWRGRFLSGGGRRLAALTFRCPRRRAGAPGAGFVVPPSSRRRGTWPLLFIGGVSLSRRGTSCSAARALCVWPLALSLPLCRRSPLRGAHGAAACSIALALLKLVLSCRRARGGVLVDRCSFVVAARFRSAACRAKRIAPLRVVVGVVASSLEAVAVARRSRRHGLRRRAGTSGAGSVEPLCSRRRDTRPSHLHGAGLPSQRGATCSEARALCTLSLARSLSLWRRSLSRGAHGSAACSAALALLATALFCRRTRGGETFGHRSSQRRLALGAVRSAQRFALPARGRWCGRFLFGGGRRRPASSAPLFTAPRWRS